MTRARRRGARPLIAALAVAASLGTASCGVPTHDEPRLVRDADVPYGLLDRPVPTTTAR
ncbi:MAG: hypothetical protein AB1673_04260 [Actinomycetota bacterium]